MSSWRLVAVRRPTHRGETAMNGAHPCMRLKTTVITTEGEEVGVAFGLVALKDGSAPRQVTDWPVGGDVTWDTASRMVGRDRLLFGLLLLVEVVVLEVLGDSFAERLARGGAAHSFADLVGPNYSAIIDLR